jgi:hypothetical protein
VIMWVLLIMATVVLVLAGLLWWITTEDDRQLDRHIRQALEGYEQEFAREGVGATPTPLRRDGYGPVLGAPSVEKVTLHEDGRTLTAEFIGAQTTGPCGADYTARAVESAHAALIVVEEHPHERGSSWDCLDVGYRRQVVVRLSRPMDQRAVLEAMRGAAASRGRGCRQPAQECHRGCGRTQRITDRAFRGSGNHRGPKPRMPIRTTCTRCPRPAAAGRGDDGTGSGSGPVTDW